MYKAVYKARVKRIVCSSCGYAPRIIRNTIEVEGYRDFVSTRYICKTIMCPNYGRDLSWYYRTLSGKTIKRKARRTHA